MSDSHVMDLPDGRDLGWLEVGDPGGFPVFGFHGTPGSRLQLTLCHDAIEAAGARLICPDRPGYGLSTYQPARRLVDWPADVARLADHIGIDRFAVIGVSGGGPHSSVCAATLADRVTSAAIVSGVGPLADPRATEGMMRSNQMLTNLSRRHSPFVRLIVGAQVEISRRWPERALTFLAKQLPESDAAILKRPEVRSLFVLDAVRASRTTTRAAVQDFELFACDWGFDLGDINVPVHLWQGTEDRNVPPNHAVLQHEAISGSVLHTVEGGGHMMVIDRLGEILRSLVPA